jgi:hypothetical protein
MLIRKTSGLTGKVHDRDIPVTQEQINDWLSGMLIQVAMPDVSPEDREFLMTGITPEEWKDVFG